MGSNTELQRIEAFSDGVFAIACTLLVLGFTVPHVEDVMRPGALVPALKRLWPSLLAYFLSFESILVAWVGHHRGVSALARSSKAFLYANGLLLLTITFMPFPTAVLAEYITTPQANIAVMFYSAAWLVTNLAFTLWWLSMFRPERLFLPSVSDVVVRRTTIQMLSGSALYIGVIVVSYWFPITAFVIIFLSQGLWIVLSVDENR